MEEQKKKDFNPSEYDYLGDEQITINAGLYKELRSTVRYFLQKNTKPYFPQKYKYINTETGKEIKKLTDKNRGTARLVVDIEGTKNSKPTIYRTEEGQSLLYLDEYMESIHFKNIEEGIAKHISELKK